MTLEIRLKLYDDASYLTSVKYNWSKCDIAKVVYLGQQTDWFYSGVFDNSVDTQSQESLNKILNIVDNSVPTIKLKTTKEGIPIKKAPWECSRLQHSRKAKDKAWHCFDTSPTHYNLMSAIIEAQDQYKTIERESKESCEIKLAKGIKYNSKQFYAYLRSKKKSNPTVSKLKKPNGEFTTSVKESADLLVKSFATVFTNETSLTRDCNMDIIAVKQIDPLIISDYDVKNELLALDVSYEDPVDLIYLDFQKAFDKVAHERLLLKLESYGITGQVHDIIRNFLTGRSMTVRVGDHISSWEPVTSGVPQGSVLGPLLFILFINDMPQVTKFNTLLFADDSKVIGNANYPEDIQTDIDCLSRWSEIWQMKFNVEKCGVLHIGESNPQHGYTKNAIELNKP
ncbi:Hypothetical predicted protein [Paramuricea clavata]|uniref:Uncharacterized protein n=1 Tax=Paramuricea clavata TaxID=317549 RepID=A0A6S7LRM2_PARCT|nr:Hypothetical predicted protein [Paramuricea clavata]